MGKAWRNYRAVRALGCENMTFGDWLRNGWRVARAQQAIAAAELMGCPAIKLIALQHRQESAATPEVRARRF